MNELILGGARSGKSRYAQERALASGRAVTYIATAVAGDAEMAERIACHRAQRPREWQLVEATHHLAATLRRHAAPDRCLLVDCLTLWLSHWLAPGPAAAGAADPAHGFNEERAQLLATLPTLPGRLILVSNEIGMGVVPLGALTRRFCDEAGRLHQDLAGLCERVTLMVAGLPLLIKGLPT
jgi:adenosylcobinamide kinase/adenosylcobinamide-phosphate guanylyltransferase